MTRSKPISMKKLYQWADKFVTARYHPTADTPKEDVQKIYKNGQKEISYLNDFLRYCWEHRNE